MAMNLIDLPEDPLAEAEEKKPEPSKKRKRRTKEQIAADNEAIELGFKNAADRADQEAKMGENKAEAEPVAQVEVAEQLQRPSLPIGSVWNLGGRSFSVAYSDTDTVVFKKA